MYFIFIFITLDSHETISLECEVDTRVLAPIIWGSLMYRILAAKESEKLYYCFQGDKSESDLKEYQFLLSASCSLILRTFPQVLCHLTAKRIKRALSMALNLSPLLQLVGIRQAI